MNAKIYNGNVQPNPKEFKIWVNDEGTIKTWNGTKWVESVSSSGSGSEEVEANAEYYRIDWDKAKELGYDENDTNILNFTGEFNTVIKSTRYVKQNAYDGEIIYIGPSGLCDAILGITRSTHVLFIPSETHTKSNNEITSIKVNSLKESNSNYPGLLDCFIPCTKEEFYSLE